MKNFPLSWTKLDTYEKCPFKFWLLYGSKHEEGKAIIPFQTSKALDEGNKKHELLERALNNRKKGIVADFALKDDPLWSSWWCRMVDKLVAEYPQSWIEDKLAVDINFKKCALDKYWQPSMGNQQVLFQGRLDAAFFNGRPFQNATEALLIDWKSGKVRKADREGQLATQAAMLFVILPKIEKVEAKFVFIDHKQAQTFKYERKELPLIKENVLERIDTLISNFGCEFDKNPGNCHWCPATRERCEYAK